MTLASSTGGLQKCKRLEINHNTRKAASAGETRARWNAENEAALSSTVLWTQNGTPQSASTAACAAPVRARRAGGAPPSDDHGRRGGLREPLLEVALLDGALGGELRRVVRSREPQVE